MLDAAADRAFARLLATGLRDPPRGTDRELADVDAPADEGRRNPAEIADEAVERGVRASVRDRDAECRGSPPRVADGSPVAAQVVGEEVRPALARGRRLRLAALGEEPLDRVAHGDRGGDGMRRRLAPIGDADRIAAHEDEAPAQQLEPEDLVLRGRCVVEPADREERVTSHDGGGRDEQRVVDVAQPRDVVELPPACRGPVLRRALDAHGLVPAVRARDPGHVGVPLGELDP